MPFGKAAFNPAIVGWRCGGGRQARDIGASRRQANEPAGCDATRLAAQGNAASSAGLTLDPSSNRYWRRPERSGRRNRLSQVLQRLLRRRRSRGLVLNFARLDPTALATEGKAWINSPTENARSRNFVEGQLRLDERDGPPGRFSKAIELRLVDARQTRPTSRDRRPRGKFRTAPAGSPYSAERQMRDRPSFPAERYGEASSLTLRLRS